MSEALSQTAAVLVAVLTCIAATIALFHNRSELHKLEKLGVIAQTMKPTSPERKLLEAIRDDLASAYGVRVLAKDIRRKYRYIVWGPFTVAMIANGITIASIFVPALIDYGGWTWALGLLAFGTFMFFLHRSDKELNAFLAAERAKWKLPIIQRTKAR